MAVTKYNAYLANFHLDRYCIVIRLFAQFDYAKLMEFCPVIESEPEFCKSLINGCVRILKFYLYERMTDNFFWIDDFSRNQNFLGSFFSEIQIENIKRAFQKKYNDPEVTMYELIDQKIFEQGFCMMYGGEKIDAFNLQMVERMEFHQRMIPVSDFKQMPEWGLYAQ